jgi:hypothetical protein
MCIPILLSQINNEVGVPHPSRVLCGRVGILISMVFRQSQNPRPVFRKKRERQGRGTQCGYLLPGTNLIARHFNGEQKSQHNFELFFSRFVFAQPSFTTCFARPNASESAGTSSVMHEAAAT